MNTWRLTTYDETWAFLRTGIAHAFVNNESGPAAALRPGWVSSSARSYKSAAGRRPCTVALRDELQAQADACVSQCNDVKTVAAAWRSFNKALGTVVTVFRCLDACYASRTERGLDSVYRVGTNA